MLCAVPWQDVRLAGGSLQPRRCSGAGAGAAPAADQRRRALTWPDRPQPGLGGLVTLWAMLGACCVSCASCVVRGAGGQRGALAPLKQRAICMWQPCLAHTPCGVSCGGRQAGGQIARGAKRGMVGMEVGLGHAAQWDGALRLGSSRMAVAAYAVCICPPCHRVGNVGGLVSGDLRAACAHVV